MPVKLYQAPRIQPLPSSLRVLSWTILNEKEGITGTRQRINFNIQVKVTISDGSTRIYKWKGVIFRHKWLSPDKQYDKEKDIKLIRQWLRKRIIKNGFHRGKRLSKQQQKTLDKFVLRFV